MEVQLQSPSILSSGDDDLSLEDAKKLLKRVETCVKYADGLRQCLVYLAQEESDIENIIIDGDSDINANLSNCHNQTVMKCTQLRAILREVQDELHELRENLSSYLHKKNFTLDTSNDENKENLG